MELTREKVVFINLMIVLVGIIFVLCGIIMGGPTAVFETFFKAIGTSLIVAGGVSFLDRFLTEKPEGVKVIAHARNKSDWNVHRRKYQTQEMDVTGVSLTSCLQEIVYDSAQSKELLHHIFHENMHLRLLFVHPDSPFIVQRAQEDGIDEKVLMEDQRQSVEYCVEFYKYLEAYCKNLNRVGRNRMRVGSIWIGLIKFCPYMAVERYDDEIYWGLYTSDATGLGAPIFLVTKKDNERLYNKLREHFNGLMYKGTHDRKEALVTMTDCGNPQLNRELVESILGEKRFKDLKIDEHN